MGGISAPPPGAPLAPGDVYEAYCAANPSTYSNRVDVPVAFNWCTVSLSGADVLVVAGLAVVIACLLHGKWSMLLTLIVGFIIQATLIPVNWAPYLSNGIAWWLRVEPYELFFYIFLPPLLLDAALRIDTFRLRKVWMQVIVLAYAIVLCATGLLIPIMLYMFNLQSSGWQWAYAALFGSMIAPTDAVAIVAILKECGSPANLRALLEGESLLNDASAITLFTIFIEQVINLNAGESDSAGSIILTIIRKIVVLGGGGLLVGLAFGIGMHIVMWWMTRHGAPRDVQIALTFAAGYLSFYVANSPCKFSGVISTAVFGLYGAYTSKWGGGAKLEEGGAFDAFWDSLAYVVNATVFFFSGIYIANYMIRTSSSLVESLTPAEYVATVFLSIPVWIMVFVIRFVLLILFKPLYWLAKSDLNMREIAFITFSGLRGCVTLIMAQAVVTETTSSGEARNVKAQVVLFAAMLVLLTLVVQGPLLSPVIRALRLTVQGPERLEVRRRAVGKLIKATERAMQQLKDDEDEMLQGVNWEQVRTTVDLSTHYQSFMDPSKHQPGFLRKACTALWQRITRRSAASRAMRHTTAATTTTTGTTTGAGTTTSTDIHTTIPMDKGGVAVDGGGAKEDGTMEGGLVAAGGGVHGVVGKKQKSVGFAGVGIEDTTTVAALNGTALNGGAGVEFSGLAPHEGTGEEDTSTPSNTQDLNTQDLMDDTTVEETVTTSAEQTSHMSQMTAPTLGQDGGVLEGPGETMFGQAGSLTALKSRRRWQALRKSVKKDIDARRRDDDDNEDMLQNAALHDGKMLLLADPAPNGRFILETHSMHPSGTASGTVNAVDHDDDSSSIFDDLEDEEVDGAEGGGHGGGGGGPTKGGRRSHESERHKRGGGGEEGADEIPFATKDGETTDLHAVDVVRGDVDEEDVMDTDIVSPDISAMNGDTAIAAAATAAAVSRLVEASDAQLADLRVRLAAGLKHHFHSKHMEGLLAAKSQRLLANACDHVIDNPQQPLDMWTGVLEKEVSHHRVTQLLGKITLKLRRLYISMKRWHCCGCGWLKRPFAWLVSITTRMLLRYLSKQMSRACEVAIEFELALIHSPLVKWLYDSHASRRLLAEVKEELKKVERFLVARELEAPDRFRAIQTHRAILAVVQRQMQTVKHLHEYGMIDEVEYGIMLEPIAANERKVLAKGPIAKAPRIKAVLKGLPFLRSTPKDLLQLLLQHGQLVEYRPSEVIADAAQVDHMFVVVQGLVQIVYHMQGRTREYYLSSGAVFGLYNVVAARPMPGGGTARGMGRALGQGPQVFKIHKLAFAKIEAMAAVGGPGRAPDPACQQLHVDVNRTAALYVMERLKPYVMPNIITLLQEMAARCRKGAPVDPDAPAPGGGGGVGGGEVVGVSPEGEHAARQRLAALFAADDEEEDEGGAAAPPPPMTTTASRTSTPTPPSGIQSPTPLASTLQLQTSSGGPTPFSAPAPHLHRASSAGGGGGVRMTDSDHEHVAPPATATPAGPTHPLFSGAQQLSLARRSADLSIRGGQHGQRGGEQGSSGGSVDGSTNSWQVSSLHAPAAPPAAGMVTPPPAAAMPRSASPLGHNAPPVAPIAPIATTATTPVHRDDDNNSHTNNNNNNSSNNGSSNDMPTPPSPLSPAAHAAAAANRLHHDDDHGQHHGQHDGQDHGEDHGGGTGGGRESLSSKAVVQACRARAREVYQRLRPLLLDAQLLDVLPGALYMASTTTVIMKGSMTTHSVLLKSIRGPGVERNPDGSRTFHAPFILPWVWDAAPEGPSQQAPAFIELHACAQHGARLLVALEDGSAVGPDNSASVSGYNTIFSLGRTVPQGQDLRTLLRTMTHQQQHNHPNTSPPGAITPPITTPASGRLSPRRSLDRLTHTHLQFPHVFHRHSMHSSAHRLHVSSSGGGEEVSGSGGGLHRATYAAGLHHHHQHQGVGGGRSMSRPSMVAGLRMQHSETDMGG